MTPAMRSLVRAADVIAVVRARLDAAGGERELEHLEGFSVYELDVLVRLERGWGPPVVPSSHRPWLTWGFPRVMHSFSPTNPLP